MFIILVISDITFYFTFSAYSMSCPLSTFFMYNIWAFNLMWMLSFHAQRICYEELNLAYTGCIDLF